MNLLHEDLTSQIIKAYYNVYNKMGFGFQERVYEKSMLIELDKFGLEAQSQQPITVFYDKEIVGEYFADIIVEGEIILELKATEKLIKSNEIQLANYLKATEIEVGLLLNFGHKPEIKRKIFHNHLK